MTDVILIGAGAEHSLAVEQTVVYGHGDAIIRVNLVKVQTALITHIKICKHLTGIEVEYDTGNADDRYIKNVDALSAGENFSVVYNKRS